MTVEAWLDNATHKLKTAQIETARLDAVVLLEDVAGKDRAWLLAHPEHVLGHGVIEKLNKQLQARVEHTPLAYIRGHTEFYGEDFLVNEHVLVPRSESEVLIELLKTYTRTHPVTRIVDIGTGSGCLAITMKLLLPEVEVHATDISKHALEVAIANAKKHSTIVQFHNGNLLKPVASLMHGKPYMLVCNLPYVPATYPINNAARNEPPQALFGGDDGLDVFRELFAQMDTAETKAVCVITEALPEQHSSLSMIAQQHGYVVQATEDFGQLFVHHD